MKIYKFEQTFADDIFTVKALEVEEKPLMYVGKDARVRKSDLNRLLGYNKMYCTENSPETYINALKEQTAAKIESYKSMLQHKTAYLEKLQAWKG